jgi:PleD family two-component response regulator
VAPGVTCSIGVLTFRNIPATVEAAVGAADGLMYQAKRRGKNTVTFGSDGDSSQGVK